MTSMDVEKAYHELLDEHGRQGWWPLLTRRDEEGYDNDGYHPGRYDYIDTDQHRFEVYAGSILTQNTQWQNAKKALQRLIDGSILSPKSLIQTNPETIKHLIESARYYNQKTTYLKAISRFFQHTTQPTRNELLNVTGVGPETADTILLYAHNEPRIIADQYTKRWLNANNVSLSQYERIATYLENRFPRSTKERQELHALIVADLKR